MNRYNLPASGQDLSKKEFGVLAGILYLVILFAYMTTPVSFLVPIVFPILAPIIAIVQWPLLTFGLPTIIFLMIRRKRRNFAVGFLATVMLGSLLLYLQFIVGAIASST